MKISFWIRAVATVMILMVLTAIMLDKLIMPWLVDHGDDVVVPDVTRISAPDAKRKLERESLTMTQKLRYDLTVPPGTVIQQSPEAGARVKHGRVVRLIVADDNRLVRVPSLVLSTYRDAIFLLQSLGLTGGTIDSLSSNEFPAGVILKQSLPEDTVVAIGTTIHLTVSLGNNRSEAVVPYVVHKSLTEAKTLIAESGLRLGKVEKKYTPDLIPDTVLSQSLDSSRVVAPLTIVDLVVSTTEP